MGGILLALSGLCGGMGAACFCGYGRMTPARILQEGEPAAQKSGDSSHSQGTNYCPLPQAADGPQAEIGEQGGCRHHSQIIAGLGLPKIPAEYLAGGSDKPLTWQDQHIGKHLQRNPQPQGETAQQEHPPPGPIGLRHQRGQQLRPQVDANREEERGRNLEELYGLKPVPEQQHLADQHGAVHQEGKHPQREPWKDKREDIGEAGHRRGAHTG